jgi:hypothetical protein
LLWCKHSLWQRPTDSRELFKRFLRPSTFLLASSEADML